MGLRRQNRNRASLGCVPSSQDYVRCSDNCRPSPDEPVHRADRRRSRAVGPVSRAVGPRRRARGLALCEGRRGRRFEDWVFRDEGRVHSLEGAGRRSEGRLSRAMGLVSRAPGTGLSRGSTERTGAPVTLWTGSMGDTVCVFETSFQPHRRRSPGSWNRGTACRVTGLLFSVSISPFLALAIRELSVSRWRVGCHAQRRGGRSL